MTAAEVLRRAADIIEERGWTRGVYERHGRVCADAALRLAGGASIAHVVAGRDVGYGEAPRALSAAVGDISKWNDRQPSRQRVTAKLREVADSLEAAS